MRCILLALLLFSTPAIADCFDETLLVSRYHYPNPGTVNQNYQDLYLLDFPALPQTVPSVTRLSNGFNAANRYDSTDAVFSLDGSKIAFVSSRDNPVTDIYVMEPTDADGNGEGDNLVRVTNDNIERFGLFWGASNRLVYVSGEDDFETTTAILNPAGMLGTETTLSNQTYDSWPPTLSSDGADVIAVFEESPFPNRLLSINHVSSSGGQITQLIYDAVWNASPSLSINDDTMYFVSSRSGGLFDIYSAPLDLASNPPSLGALTNVTNSSGLSESDVKVSPDGMCIAYLGNDLATSYGPNSDLYIADLSSQVTRRVTSTRDIGSFDWMPATGGSSSVAAGEQIKETEVQPTALKCKPFLPSEIKSQTINGIKVHIHSTSAPANSSRVERCTLDIPPFRTCRLSKIENASQGRSCEVRPTSGTANQGRWSLILRNKEGSQDLNCSMTCTAN